MTIKVVDEAMCWLNDKWMKLSFDEMAGGWRSMLLMNWLVFKIIFIWNDYVMKH
jgi:hypothetical protein